MHERENDLVAATQGRSFWILDDLSPLQQMAGATEGVHLFNPRRSWRVAGGQGDGRARPGLGQNPPPGVIVDFNAPEVTDSTTVTVEILDAGGDVLRTYGNQASDAVGGDTLKFKSGHNRLSWNLRRETVKNVKGLYVWGSLAGTRAKPGIYTVRLTVNDAVLEAPAQVEADPRVNATDFEAQDDFAAQLTTALNDLHRGVEDLRNVRGQIQAFLSRAPEDAEIDSAGQALVATLDAVEDAVVQKRTVDGQTVINWPSRVRERLIYLRGTVNGAEGEVTDGSRAAFADLSALWEEQQEILSEALGARLDAFNALVAAREIPAIVR